MRRLVRAAAGGLAVVLVAAVPATGARTPVIRTAAGSLGHGHPRSVNQFVHGLAVSGSTVYAADYVYAVVRAFDTAGRREWVVAGTGNTTTYGTAGLATRVGIAGPTAVAAHPGGGFVVGGGGYVQRVDRAGRISVVAGGGTRTGPVVDGTPARDLALGKVADLAVGKDGTVYAAHPRSQQVLAFGRDGTAQVVAGTGLTGHAGLGGPAKALSLNQPLGVAVTGSGDVLVVDNHNHRVVRVDPLGIAHPFAGLGPAEGYSGDGGPAALAQLKFPSDVAVAPSGDVLIAEFAGIRRVSPDGVVSTFSRDQAATLAVAANGDVYFSGGPTVHVRRARGGVAVIAGVTGGMAGRHALAGGVPSRLQTARPNGVDVRGGVLYWTDHDSKAWRLRNGRAAIITADSAPFFDPSAVGDDPYRGVLLLSTSAIAAAPNGRQYVTDSSGSQIYELRGYGRRLVAGRDRICVPNDNPNVGDGGPATEAVLCYPGGIAVAGSTIYVADTLHHRVRAIDARGRIRTVAGTGRAGYSGDGGRATSAALAQPADVTVGPDGSLYIADAGNLVVRRVGRDGVIRTVAGTAGVAGSSGDGGPARSARFTHPVAVEVAPDGSVFVADAEASVVRRIDRRGIITTVAGNRRNEFSGDGGPARAAGLGCPNDIAYDGTTARLYIADTCNTRVRVVQF